MVRTRCSQHGVHSGAGGLQGREEQHDNQRPAEAAGHPLRVGKAWEGVLRASRVVWHVPHTVVQLRRGRALPGPHDPPDCLPLGPKCTHDSSRLPCTQATRTEGFLAQHHLPFLW